MLRGDRGASPTPGVSPLWHVGLRRDPQTPESTQTILFFSKSRYPPVIDLVPCRFSLYIYCMDILIPDIEDIHPIPASASEALPDLSPTEELEMRARTIKLLSDLSGRPLVPTDENKHVAEELARRMVQDPAVRPDYAKYPNETMAYLAGMITQHKVQLVDELTELKMYVVNKLIFEVEHAKMAKDRISALTKLGDIDGVDAFKKRTEMTIQIKPIEEVEKELLSVLENIEYAVEPENDGSS